MGVFLQMSKTQSAIMHQSIKKCLGYKEKESSDFIIKDWKKRTSEICKPCWELNYCPFGPLVEQFPLVPPTRDSAVEHNEYLIMCLAEKKLGTGKKLDFRRKKIFEEQVAGFKPDNYPESIPGILVEASCRFFGHICPVFFVAEPFTETKNRRSHSRTISRDVMLKIIRRDGQICQKCNEPVLDHDVEFDHIIPYSKGGTSTVGNLRLIHKNCNRKKSNSLDEILHERPLDHLFEIKGKAKVKK